MIALQLLNVNFLLVRRKSTCHDYPELLKLIGSSFFLYIFLLWGWSRHIYNSSSFFLFLWFILEIEGVIQGILLLFNDYDNCHLQTMNVGILFWGSSINIYSQFCNFIYFTSGKIGLSVLLLCKHLLYKHVLLLLMFSRYSSFLSVIFTCYCIWLPFMFISYNIGVISTKKSLAKCDKLSVSLFCR